LAASFIAEPRASFRWRFQKLRLAARMEAGRSLVIRREVRERHSTSLPPFIPLISHSSIHHVEAIDPPARQTDYDPTLRFVNRLKDIGGRLKPFQPIFARGEHRNGVLACFRSGLI
jgi:hypothetical protein